ncbi:alpha-amylase [Cyanobium gracile]|uniref:Glycosidase n=1 Tax=Cyanobium gracile (strain ATCC 27147 / PCC 6307) TaxID=292564 RepID=K9P7U5_CYAGP|nr:alpha-amylase [Cyanobium gracile]AFY28639.1 glycosidase [Cyanobium gracile PCC 6307]
MASLFEALKQEVLAVEKDPALDTGTATVTLLQEWLASHEAEISARKLAAPTEFNGTLMQWFHWYSDGDGGHWRRLRQEAPALARAGITALWLPPAGKGGSVWDVGYGTYDLFDLGEFDQKGTVRTKYGTKQEYLEAIQACRGVGIQVYADVVFNHKLNADEQEQYRATPYDPADRNRPLGEERTISAWTRFRFDGRGNHYSSMQWHWYHFDAVDHNSLDPDFKAIWRTQGAGFEGNVDLEKGNYDYLMGSDLNVNHPEVRGELKHWGLWTLDHVGADGFRLDAIKHIASDFFLDWISSLEEHAQRDLFVVGEYWTYNIESLHWYAANTGGHMSLFDAPLHMNFHQASRSGGNYDMRRLLDGTLMQQLPLLAVTLVENHDTQPLQSLESVVEAWFKPLAYAVILLRDQGYPCIFHADYYGADYTDRKDGQEYRIVLPSHRFLIDRFLLARGHCAYGPQYDYLDHVNTIGWTRLGTSGHPGAMAVLMSDGPAGHKWMEVGKRHTTFRDLTGHIQTPITTNGDGWAEWHCPGGSVSVWVEADALTAMGVTL